MTDNESSPDSPAAPNAASAAPETKPESERQKRDKLRLAVTDRLLELVSSPKCRASAVMAAIRFLAETNSLDAVPPGFAQSSVSDGVIQTARGTIKVSDLPFDDPIEDVPAAADKPTFGRMDDF